MATAIEKLVNAGVDREVRGAEGPSDHAPTRSSWRDAATGRLSGDAERPLLRRSRAALAACQSRPRSGGVLVSELMSARRAVGVAKRHGDLAAEAQAHRAVDDAKQALGERGPVWWTDSAPDLNRQLARTTPYAAWFAGLDAAPPAK